MKRRRRLSALGLALVVFGLSPLLACRGRGRAPTAPTTPTPSAANTAAAIFLSPNSWDLRPGDGPLPITIVTAATAAGNVPAPHVAVTLTASSGTLSDGTVETDRTGHATVVWTGTGAATITARAGDATASLSIRLVVPTPEPIPSSPPGPPSPEPPPDHSHLVVDIIPSARITNARTPVIFNSQVRGWDGASPAGLTYAWDFGDGTTSTDATPTHTFTPADHWTVRLYVTTDDGRTGLGTIAIVVGK